MCSYRLSVTAGGGELRVFLHHDLELEPSLAHICEYAS